MSKVVNLSKKTIVGSLSSVAAGAVGFGAGQALLSKVNKPIGDVAAFAGGIALATSDNPHIKMLGTGVAVVSGFRLANRFSNPTDGSAPNAIQGMISKFIPNLQGLGEIGELGYGIGNVSAEADAVYDQDGNLIEMDGYPQDYPVQEAQELLGVADLMV